MPIEFRLSRLIPSGFAVGTVSENPGVVVLEAKSAGIGISGLCPRCATASRKIHSRYIGTVWDLPCAGQKVVLHLTARRFFCTVESCRQRIFAERFTASILSPRGRRTGRLDCLAHHLGLALGGRPAANFASADAATKQ